MLVRHLRHTPRASLVRLTMAGCGPASDTIDLQDPQAPSAQDHTRQPHRPNPLGGGPSPHQADALRHAEQVSASEQQRSPRVSWIEGDGVTPEGHGSQGVTARRGHDHFDDGFADDATIVADGTRTDSPADDMTLIDNDDDGLDDDMMQNMSSSPSIDDGGSYQFPPLLQATTSHFTIAPVSTTLQNSASLPDEASSSPYYLSPLHLPLSSQPQAEETPWQGSGRHHHHRHGGYSQGHPDVGPKANVFSRAPWPQDPFMDPENNLEGAEPSVLQHDDPQDVDPFEDVEDCLQADPEGDILEDPFLLEEETLLDLGLAQLAPPPIRSQHRGVEWTKLLIPEIDCEYTRGPTGRGDDDDSGFDVDDELSFFDDPLFLDPNWAAHYLHGTEDIDFEFVYALHSFTATVEGQANASKGETMVLLDDSNSYWWLVRVVKDSSIGSSYVQEHPQWFSLTELCSVQGTYLRNTSRHLQSDWHDSTSIEILTFVTGFYLYRGDMRLLTSIARGDDAGRQRREIKESVKKGHATAKCKDCSVLRPDLLRGLRYRLLDRRGGSRSGGCGRC